MSRAEDHEVVSIYPHSQDQIEKMMTLAPECVLNWATRDGWPVGVMHAFVWDKGKVWLTFSSHRHRTEAIKRDPRVSIVVSGTSSRDPECPPPLRPGRGEHAVFHDDEATKKAFYRKLAHKVSPTDKAGEDDFYSLLDSPLRTVIEVTPEKWITFDAEKSHKHRQGTLDESELGKPLSGDTERMNAERAKRGLPPRQF